MILYDAMSLQHDHRQIARTIELARPDIVGVTAATAMEPDAREVCRAAKQVDRTILTVLGNIHPTFHWAEILEQDPAVDVVVRGEGEQAFADLVRAVAAGAGLDGVAGLALRRTGRPTVTRLRPFWPDLDTLEPAWDLLDWKTYFYRPSPVGRLAVVSSSRGRTQACSFCSQHKFWSRNWRGRSPESFAELEGLRDRFGVRVVMLADETPTTDPARWARLLDLLIERRVGLEILIETRVDHILRDEMLPRY